jgi:hypothetical protein
MFGSQARRERCSDRSTPIRGNQNLGPYGVLSRSGTQQGYVHVHA